MNRKIYFLLICSSLLWFESTNAKEQNVTQKVGDINNSKDVLVINHVSGDFNLTYMIDSKANSVVHDSKKETFTFKIGNAISKKETEIKFVKIKQGCFTMGSPINEEHGNDNEKPQHQVCIKKDFWLSETEITQEQWLTILNKENSDSKFKTATRPVENISWDDTKKFIDKLNSVASEIFKRAGETGKFRLPSESEWEYTARAGEKEAFFTGKCITINEAHYDAGSGIDIGFTQINPGIINPNNEVGDCNSINRKGISPSMTNIVKSFKPNKWGLYDMAGNVWEWVQDCWNENYQNRSENSAAMETGDCTQHVLRGGSWNSLPKNIRSAVRIPAYHDNKDETMGFRIAKDL